MCKSGEKMGTNPQNVTCKIKMIENEIKTFLRLKLVVSEKWTKEINTLVSHHLKPQSHENGLTVFGLELVSSFQKYISAYLKCLTSVHLGT